MELRRYIAIIRRWLWLGILGLVIGAAAGYFGSAYQTPVYQASTRFVILRSASSSYDYAAYLDSQQLVQTYVQLLTTDSVLTAASTELGYQVGGGQAQASQVDDTQFVRLTVEDTNPQHAADIANVLVSVLIDQNEQLQSIRYVSSEQNLQEQLDQVLGQINTLQTQINEISSATVADQLVQVQGQIDTLQNQITELETQIVALKKKLKTPERDAEISDKEATLAQIEPVLALYQQVYTNLVVLGKPVESADATSTRLEQLRTTLELYQQIYVNLLNSLEAVRLARVQNTPNVKQVEPATPSSSPIRPRPMETTMLAAAIGLALAAGIAFLVEYLDTTLKTMDDIERVLNLPVIGYIAQIQHGKKGSDESLYVTRQPRSPVSEAFRSLRANLEFAGVDKPIRRILVTSAGPNEGKSTISTNLAAIIAQGGKKVFLIDADLRRPKVHRFLRLSNQFGLSDLFRTAMPVGSVAQKSEEHENLHVITSGSLPPNPAELLASARMDALLAEADKEADMVVIDSPPTLVADAQVLSSKVDGVILVIYPGHTHADAVQATLEQLNRAGAHIVGVVLNRIPRDRADYYGGYRHYSPYYSGYHYYSVDEGQAGKKASAMARLFRFGSSSNGNGKNGKNGHKGAQAPEDTKTKAGKTG